MTSTTSTTSQMKASEILDQLQQLYSGSGWAFLREFKLGTGKVRRDPSKGQPRAIKQRLDALAYNTWPSAHEIISFEVKCSRQDFLNEIANPKKREAAVGISNKFYFVTTGNVVMHVNEIPTGCGWIFIDRAGPPIVEIEAEYRDRDALPQHVIHSLFRRLARAEGTYVTPVRKPRRRKRISRGRSATYSRRRKM